MIKLETLDKEDQRRTLLTLMRTDEERVALRAFFLLYDVYHNAPLAANAEPDFLFGGDNAALIEFRPIWVEGKTRLWLGYVFVISTHACIFRILVCKFVIDIASERCKDWRVFCQLVRSVRASLQRHKPVPSDGIDTTAFEELEFRVSCDLGLDRTPAQMLVDCAVSGDFVRCNRVNDFYGDSISDDAKLFWQNEERFATVREDTDLTVFRSHGTALFLGGFCFLIVCVQNCSILLFRPTMPSEALLSLQLRQKSIPPTRSPQSQSVFVQHLRCLSAECLVSVAPLILTIWKPS